MGLYDSIYLKPNIKCPQCNSTGIGRLYTNIYDGEKYIEWQTKDLWCLMQHYYEGKKMKIKMTNNLKFIAKGNEKIKVHRGCLNCGAFLGGKIIIKDGIPKRIIKIKKLPTY